MRPLFLFFALPLLACSSNEPPVAPITDAASTPDVPKVCTPFDAGPRTDTGLAADAADAADDADADPTDAGPDVEVNVPGSLRPAVDKVFAVSCSFASCHGSLAGKGKLSLPCTPRADMMCPKDARVGDWWPEVVGRTSSTHRTMKRVEPYDPQHSFLAHKVSEGLCALDKECVNGDCGDRMPDESDAVDPADRETILGWIRQGAPRK